MCAATFDLTSRRVKPIVKIGLILAAAGIGIIFAFHLLGSRTKTGGADSANGFTLGKTETQSSVSSATTSSASENAGFSARRIFLLADNPHPLNRRVVALVEQQLQDCALIGQLETTNGNFTLTNGLTAPDLFLRVDLVALQQAGILSRTMNATMGATFGNQPWQGTSYGQDDSSPPLVSFMWSTTLETASTFSGIRSDRYREVAHSMADEITKAVRKMLEEYSAKYPALPELPRDFYGPYQPVADFNFLKALPAHRAASYCGLLTHNQTFWQFQTTTNPVPQLRHIITQLEADGWKISDTSLTNTEAYRIHARLGETELEIFREREFIGLNPMSKIETEMPFIAHYRQPFTRAERDAALEKLFNTPQSVETLLPFSQSFSAAQREKFHALVEKSPVSSAPACVQLAEFYLNRKQTNAAVNQLLRAKVLTATVSDSSALQSKIEELAKKISPKKKLKLAVTAETCHELGFLEITNAPRIELELPLGQPLIFFSQGGEHGVKIYTLRIRPPQKGYYAYVCLQSQDGMHSSSSSSFSADSKNGWRENFTADHHTLTLTALPLPDKKQVKFTIEAKENP